jgi:hypothetical protein
MSIYEAGIWEQHAGFVAWSKHRTADLAKNRALTYAKRLKTESTQAGGALSWAGGVRGTDGSVRWYDSDGAELSAAGA